MIQRIPKSRIMLITGYYNIIFPLIRYSGSKHDLGVDRLLRKIAKRIPRGDTINIFSPHAWANK